MKLSLVEKITLERSLIYVIIGAVLITFSFIFYLFFVQLTTSIQVTSPVGFEDWEIGKTYQITWKSRGVDKVGIALFNGEEAKWIAKDVPASAGKYDWKIYPGQDYGDNYWISVFEYPYKSGNDVSYSIGAFAITFPELASCDNLSTEKSWPFIPSDLPDLRRVFITEQKYSGNLGGLDGADNICQGEAQDKGYEGSWHAFIGGESDQELAVQRLKDTPRGLDGVYIEAGASAVLLRGETCHRLLGKNFDSFFNSFSDLSVINQTRYDNSFFQELDNVWVGRVDVKSKKNCTGIAAVMAEQYKTPAEKYSFTTTCQGWTKGDKFAEGYTGISSLSDPSFPTCYTPSGSGTKSVVLGGLGIGLQGEGNDKEFSPYLGKYCDEGHKLICIEE